ncbi:MAG TPA: hypothetical protein VFK89_09920 [Actinomycetota bacterium]|nr:hypothetical protein [Actinomycetota bacterium]
MVGLLITAQAVAVAAMVGVSLWGSRRIPDNAQVRARVGLSFDYTMSKTTALVSTPLVALLYLAASLAVRDSIEEPFAWLGLAVMLIFVASHVAAVRRAAR